MKNQQGFIGIAAAIIVVVGLLGGGYYFLNQAVKQSAQPFPAAIGTSAGEVPKVAPTPSIHATTSNIGSVNPKTGPADYNNDGATDNIDVNFLTMLIQDSSACPTGKICDMNNDDKVTDADVVTLTKAIAGAMDSQIRANLSSIRLYAELFYEDHSYSYGEPGATPDACTGIGVPPMFKDTKYGFAKELQAIPTNKGCNVSSDGKSYAVWAALSQGYWCVDSAHGNKQYVSRPVVGSTKCL